MTLFRALESRFEEFSSRRFSYKSMALNVFKAAAISFHEKISSALPRLDIKIDDGSIMEMIM